MLCGRARIPLLAPIARYLRTTSATLSSSHYQTLGVSRSADPKLIKAAYFALAKKCHPDVSSDSSSKAQFQEISRAYAVLSDAQLRTEYNTSLEEEDIVFNSDVFREESAEGIFTSAFGINFEDMFNSRFGYTAEIENTREYVLGISMMEAVLGSAKYIEINTHQRCTKCQGYGAAQGAPSTRVECPRCFGGGTVPFDKPSGTEWLNQKMEKMPDFATCGDCLGKGFIMSAPCDNCMGKGRLDAIQWHPVSVPPGVKHGQSLSCPGIDGAPMLVTIHILRDMEEKYEYDSQENVSSCILVHYSMLVTGGPVGVRTIDGELHKLDIPPGTNPGTLVELPDYEPVHVFEVQLFLPNAEWMTSHVTNLHCHLTAEEEKLALGEMEIPCNVQYCNTEGMNTLPMWKLFRNDVYHCTVRPVYRLFIYWPFYSLYGVAKRVPKLGPFLKSLETVGGHTHYYPRNRKNAMYS